MPGGGVSLHRGQVHRIFALYGLLVVHGIRVTPAGFTTFDSKSSCLNTMKLKENESATNLLVRCEELARRTAESGEPIGPARLRFA